MEIEEEAKIERVHLETLDTNLRDVLVLLENNLALYTEPQGTPTQSVYNYCRQRVKVKHTEPSLNPIQELEALDVFENWYSEKEIEFPIPDWLTDKRNFWNGRAEGR